MPRTIKDVQRDRQDKIDERDRELGWYTPTKRENLASLRKKVKDARAELAELERQLTLMESEMKLEALVACRNLMRAHGLTLDDVLPKRRRKPSH